MARPQRNTVDYFPFDCQEGKKMFYLEERYGNDGFAVFVKILRELARTEYHYLDLSKKTTLMFLSAKCRVSIDLLELIINDLTELEKFDKKLWSENKIIWCQDFIESIKDAYIKRSNECMTYEGLQQHLISLGVRKQSKCSSKGDVKPQTILDYTKEKENILQKKQDEFKSEVKSFSDRYDKHILKDFYLYWSEPTKKKDRMRKELERTWDTSRRLSTWFRRSSK